MMFDDNDGAMPQTDAPAEEAAVTEEAAPAVEEATPEAPAAE